MKRGRLLKMKVIGMFFLLPLLQICSFWQENNCKNCQLRTNCGSVVAAWDNQQFRKVFRMNRSSMQFIPFEFLNSEDYPSRLCKIKNMAEKYVLAFLWLVILGASENYVVFKPQHIC
jgi:hypothetical protein